MASLDASEIYKLLGVSMMVIPRWCVIGDAKLQTPEWPQLSLTLCVIRLLEFAQGTALVALSQVS